MSLAIFSSGMRTEISRSQAVRPSETFAEAFLRPGAYIVQHRTRFVMAHSILRGRGEFNPIMPIADLILDLPEGLHKFIPLSRKLEHVA